MSVIKRLVSKKKKRFQEEGFDLDLSYVTPRVIAMGFPSSSLEGMYRNSMADVKKFFARFHDDHYKVYNLCSEKAYKPAEFGNSCVGYPFPDHNPCPFDMIIRMMEDVHAYLAADAKNVAAIHCKAGKGRTGMMISCYLVFSGECKTANDALDKFGAARTHNNKGVTIPSQQRYVRYFEFFLKHYYRPKPQRAFNFKGVPLKLKRVKMWPIANFDVGGGCDPYFLLTDVHGKNFYNHKKQKGVTVREWRKEGVHEIECDAAVQGDVHVHFMDEDTLSADDKMFGFWFHTSMVRRSPLVLTKAELDSAVKDRKCKHFPANFYIELVFDGVPPFDEKEGDVPKPRPEAGAAAESSDDEDNLDDQPPPPPPLLEGQVSAAAAIIPPPPPPEIEAVPSAFVAAAAADVKTRPAAGSVPPPPPPPPVDVSIPGPPSYPAPLSPGGGIPPPPPATSPTGASRPPPPVGRAPAAPVRGGAPVGLTRSPSASPSAGAAPVLAKAVSSPHTGSSSGAAGGPNRQAPLRPMPPTGPPPPGSHIRDLIPPPPPPPGQPAVPAPAASKPAAFFRPGNVGQSVRTGAAGPTRTPPSKPSGGGFSLA